MRRDFDFAPRPATIEYELYAEDMQTVRETLKLPEIGNF
jgi:hypothetical protein